MHELGTVMYIIRTVEDCCRENQLSKVASVTLQVGEVSGILPKYLCDCWDWAVKRTEYMQEAELRIEPIEAVTLCTDCGEEYSTVKYAKICPRCGSERTYLLTELADRMRGEQRVPCPAGKLVIGLKCGGSDGFSGITANPVIGGFSDLLVAQGGSTILTEVPEMFGAETILMDRCETEDMFRKTVALINDFKRYFEEHHQTIYENPSPGNKAGGISTLEDKALGCTQKSGFSPVKDVLAYGEKVRVPGLNLLSVPGNDLVAATALAASGAQIVLFSTGRGTPFACPVPTVKIASNTPLAQRKHGWIDFNAGALLTDGKSLPELSQALMDFVLEAASGRKVCSEQRGFHDLAIFKTGVTL